ncbi:hypothetical protein [Pontibacter sp. G13]|uniref:LVIVD repeat-containing protein n=1 Tax=Pontibacter sp. G13 TaxID=3074898 RepID=UPI00288B80C1|nr:hypothetical protein [Pontibacter sp. G13]WNJ16030.1 hypothetical protein RJD25_14300 [Pontibacter sp. G13]
MKTQPFFSKFAMVAGFCSFLLLQGCIKDSCDMTIQYREYTPVYLTQAEFLETVGVEAPREMAEPGKIYVKDDFLFVNELGRGVHIFDNKNPQSPQAIAFLNVPGASEVAFTCDQLIVDASTDLMVFDLTTPSQPVLASHLPNVLPQRLIFNGYTADPSKGRIISWESRIREGNYECNQEIPTIWEMNAVDPQTAAEEGNNTRTMAPASIGKGGSLSRFALLGDKMYVVSTTELSTYRLSDCGVSHKIGTENLFFGIGEAEMVSTMNDILMIGGTEGVAFFGTESDHPEFLSTFQHMQACDPVVGADGIAYVTLRDGEGSPCGNNFTNQLDVLSLENPRNPVLMRSFDMTNPHGLGIEGNTLFIADGRDGVKVFDATNPFEVGDKLLKVLPGMKAVDVIPFNGILYTVGESGVSMYDYSDLDNISLLSEIPAVR